jgi:hypothetical protein
MFATASGSFWPWTNGTGTGFVASSWSCTFVYTYQPPATAAAIRSAARSHGQNERRRAGSSYS